MFFYLFFFVIFICLVFFKQARGPNPVGGPKGGGPEGWGARRVGVPEGWGCPKGGGARRVGGPCRRGSHTTTQRTPNVHI